MRIHHIGNLVKDIQKACVQFKNLGYDIISEKFEDYIQRVYIIFVQKDGYLIELIQPMDKDSRVWNMSKNNTLGGYTIYVIN